jgi:hypothetical protein
MQMSKKYYRKTHLDGRTLPTHEFKITSLDGHEKRRKEQKTLLCKWFLCSNKSTYVIPKQIFIQICTKRIFQIMYMYQQIDSIYDQTLACTLLHTDD